MLRSDWPWFASFWMLFACLAIPERSFAATINWSGQGDGINWSDPANWAGGMVPGASDHAYVSNSWVGSSFSVVLPSGSVTTTLQRLTIYPGPKQAITMVLPATNTGNPGLRVGDGVGGTDDIDLRDSAILSNESGSLAGNGIEVSSLANGTARIRTGARYLHRSPTNAAGVASRLVADATTTFGEFVYNVPGSQPYAIAASGITYGSLTLLRLSPATYTSSGSSPFVVAGDLNVGAGVSYSTTMSGPLRLYGLLVSTPTTLTIAQPVEFAGFTFVEAAGDSLELDLLAASTADTAYLQTDSDVTLELHGAFANEGGAEISGAVRMADGGDASGNPFFYDVGSRLEVVGFTPRTVTAGSAWWPGANGPLFVDSDAPVTLNATRPVTELIARRALAGVTPTYSIGSRLVYAGTITATGTEWGPGTTLGPGVPYEVEVAVPAAQTLALPSADRAVRGNLLLTSGTLSNPSSAAKLRVSGNLVVEAAGHLAGNGAIAFDGDLASPGGSRKLQTISGPAGLAIPYLVLEKSDLGGGVGLVRLLSDLTLTAPAGGVSLAFNGAHGGVLDLNGKTLNVDNGTVDGSDPSPYFYGSPTSSLYLRGTGAGGTLRFATAAVAGTNYAKLGTFWMQRAEGVTLDSPLEVSGTLQLTSGRVVVTSPNTLSLAAGASLAGGSANAYVAGRLERTLPPESPLVTFPIGDALRYTPVDIYAHSLTAALPLTASTTGADHPQIASAGFFTNKTVNRHFTLTSASAAAVTYEATFRFDAADVDPGADPTKFVVRRLPVSTWLAPKRAREA